MSSDSPDRVYRAYPKICLCPESERKDCGKGGFGKSSRQKGGRRSAHIHLYREAMIQHPHIIKEEKEP